MAFIASRRALLSPAWEPASLGSWAPTDLGASLIAWWDAGSGVTESGGAVSAWADSVGALTVAQGTAGNKPTYSATSFRGAPGITFDGGDYLSVASTGSLPSGGNACEIWALVDQTALPADTASRMIFGYGNALGTGRRSFYRRVLTGANQVRAEVGNGSTTTPINFTATGNDFSGPNVARIAIGASASVGQVNGGPQTAPVSVTPNTATSITTIGISTAIDLPFQGVIAAILVTGALTIDQAKYLTAYLTRRAFG